MFSSIFNNNLSSGCEVVSHCSLDLHFLKEYWCWTSFYVLIGHLYIFFWEMYIQILHPFLNWIVCLFNAEFMYFLYYLMDIWFANIFFHFLDCPFTFWQYLMIKVFNFEEFIFSSAACVFGVISEKKNCLFKVIKIYTDVFSLELYTLSPYHLYLWFTLD